MGHANIVYSDMPLEDSYKQSIFLAGPTFRARKDRPHRDIGAWRLEAYCRLDNRGYEDAIFVPERLNWEDGFEYEDQIGWELKAMELADTIVFWVPREMKDMPALTTNVEFGMWINDDTKHIVYGRPDDAVSCRYLDELWNRRQVRLKENKLSNPSEVFTSLEDVMEEVIRYRRVGRRDNV